MQGGTVLSDVGSPERGANVFLSLCAHVKDNPGLNPVCIHIEIWAHNCCIHTKIQETHTHMCMHRHMEKKAVCMQSHTYSIIYKETYPKMLDVFLYI